MGDDDKFAGVYGKDEDSSNRYGINDIMQDKISIWEYGHEWTILDDAG